MGGHLRILGGELTFASSALPHQKVSVRLVNTVPLTGFAVPFASKTFVWCWPADSLQTARCHQPSRMCRHYMWGMPHSWPGVALRTHHAPIRRRTR